jgi:hypothetical protein
MTTIEEIKVIRRIVAREKWLYGEQIGRDPGPNHAVVMDRVAQIILQIGQAMREGRLEEFEYEDSNASKDPDRGPNR